MLNWFDAYPVQEQHHVTPSGLVLSILNVECRMLNAELTNPEGMT
jgi:hypothetical protein